MAGTSLYVLRRSASCLPADVEAVLNQLATEGFEVVQVIVHHAGAADTHDHRACLVDIIGKRK